MIALLAPLAGLLAAGCSSTYQREFITKQIEDLAQREYQLEVEAKEAGETVGVQIRMPNMLAELGAEDQRLATQIDDLMMVLTRVALSCDRPPRFLVLDVVDRDNNRIHFTLTRYVPDLRMLMGGALSRNDFTDRLLMEFHIGDRVAPFDPYEMDLIRLMLLGVEVMGDEPDPNFEFEIEDVDFEDFLAKVSANMARRTLREERDLRDAFVLRQVTATYEDAAPADPKAFRILLDLVAQPTARIPAGFIEGKVLPFVAEEASRLFRSYRFDDFSSITVVEKNSGEALTVLRG